MCVRPVAAFSDSIAVRAFVSVHCWQKSPCIGESESALAKKQTPSKSAGRDDVHAAIVGARTVCLRAISSINKSFYVVCGGPLRTVASCACTVASGKR